MSDRTSTTRILGALAGRAARAALERTKEALDPDRLLQLSMEGLIEAARARHAETPSPRWRPGEPLDLLLAGYAGSHNTGADVRVEEMIRQLRHLLGDEHVSLTVLTTDPNATRGYFRTAQQAQLPQIFPKFLFDRVRRHHGVVACEGSMFKSKFATALSTMMVGALGLAVAEEKLSVGYGGEAGAMDAGLESMIRRSLGDRTLVLTRNEESRAVLAPLGVRTELGTDTAWTYPDPPPELAAKVLRRAGWDERAPILVVCPIHPFWWPVRPDPVRAAVHALTGAHDRAHYDSIYFHESGPSVDERFARYLAALAGAIDDARRERGFFPVVLGMEALDREACDRLADLLARRAGASRPPTIVADEHGPNELVGVLRRASLIVSSRYHALVCSMPALVPSIGVTMDERIRNLMEDRGQGDLALRVDDDDLDESLGRAIGRVLADPEASRAAIETSVARNLRRMGEMGAHFVDHVREHHPRFPIRAELGHRGAGTDALAHLPALDPAWRARLERLPT